jgi:hypothetical protein
VIWQFEINVDLTMTGAPSKSHRHLRTPNAPSIPRPNIYHHCAHASQNLNFLYLPLRRKSKLEISKHCILILGFFVVVYAYCLVHISNSLVHILISIIVLLCMPTTGFISLIVPTIWIISRTISWLLIFCSISTLGHYTTVHLQRPTVGC